VYPQSTDTPRCYSFILYYTSIQHSPFHQDITRNIAIDVNSSAETVKSPLSSQRTMRQRAKGQTRTTILVRKPAVQQAPRVGASMHDQAERTPAPPALVLLSLNPWMTRGRLALARLAQTCRGLGELSCMLSCASALFTETLLSNALLTASVQ
jgi:hypothetical protein